MTTKKNAMDSLFKNKVALEVALKNVEEAIEEQGYARGFIEGKKAGIKEEKEKNKASRVKFVNGKRFIQMNNWLEGAKDRFAWDSNHVKEMLFDLAIIDKDEKGYVYTKNKDYFAKVDGIIYVSMDIVNMMETSFMKHRMKHRDLSNLENLKKEIEIEGVSFYYRISMEEAKLKSPLFVQHREKLGFKK